MANFELLTLELDKYPGDKCPTTSYLPDTIFTLKLITGPCASKKLIMFPSCSAKPLRLLMFRKRSYVLKTIYVFL